MPNDRKCSTCDGKGKAWYQELFTNPVTKEKELRDVYRTCKSCNGRGTR